MAAEVAAARGLSVGPVRGQGLGRAQVPDRRLVADLNLTHSDPPERLRAALRRARAGDVRPGCANSTTTRYVSGREASGIETFVGSSGRVFPADMKAAPLLRAWVRRLRESGVRFHVGHGCPGWDRHGALLFDSPSGAVRVTAGATVLALGGAAGRNWAPTARGRGGSARAASPWRRCNHPTAVSTWRGVSIFPIASPAIR